MNIEIVHLFERAEHLDEVARWIREEWWSDKPGHSASTMAARLAEAGSRDRIPLSLLALGDGRPRGTVNLVENDNDERPDLTPWLAALLVTPAARGRGVGCSLVRALLTEAARLGVQRLYLGTVIPHYYELLGAEVLEAGADGYHILSFDTDA